VAFYRERYLPVRNAVKVFSIYRIGDVGLLLAMWASHQLWHENISFLKLGNYELVHEHLQGHSAVGIFISLMLLLAAAAKSAQFPFSSWLPRAMEGPTPSSAIFYGSLSVHFGVFLLLRTYPFWEEQTIVRVFIGLLGLTSAVVASSIGRVQSSLKTQIAYASIAQIGIIFIEIALGLESLALIHFAGNAFLRTYQLLVSPSAVSYLINDQLYNFKAKAKTVEDTFPKKVEYAIFKLSLREYYLDELPSRLIFTPLKKVGHRLDFLTLKNSAFFFFPAYVIGLYFLWHKESVNPMIIKFLPVVFASFGLLLILKALGERKQARLAFTFLIMNHLWVALAISFNEKINYEHLFLYLGGALLAGLLGFIVLSILRKKEPEYFTLNKYYGHAYEHPRLAFFFLLACLGVMGFPITSTFIGVDLVFSHIHANQFLLAFINSMSFVFGGIVAMRMYARLFLGPHVKTYHDVALKSS